MGIAEMHVWFRQYAQQMGMQNVRAILPEQIDLLINSSITDTINQIITQNIGMTNDRVITDNSKIGQINALRSLYKVTELPAEEFAIGSETTTYKITRSLNGGSAGLISYYKVTANGSLIGSLEEQYNNAALKYDFSSYAAALAAASNLMSGTAIRVFTIGTCLDYLYLVDLSINFTNSKNSITNYFPIRLIDDSYLADTLNDFILKPRLRTPIAVIYNDQLDIYIDDKTGDNLPFGLEPNKIRVSYIAKPAKVCYSSDLGGTNVDCDLPEYMHIDILKHAVDLYHIATSGSLHAAQQQEQAQQQEGMRNNYRNEGNQKQ